MIDFGDAVFSHTINDLAIAIAYAVMDKPDPLAAALHIVRGATSRRRPRRASTATCPSEEGSDVQSTQSAGRLRRSSLTGRRCRPD